MAEKIKRKERRGEKASRREGILFFQIYARLEP